MTLHNPHLQPLAAILAGLLILFVPRILNYVVAAYLILVGILGLGLSAESNGVRRYQFRRR
jgi:hypothetical protein